MRQNEAELPPAAERFETALDGFEIILRRIDLFAPDERTILRRMVWNGQEIIRRRVAGGGVPGSRRSAEAGPDPPESLQRAA